MFVTLYGLSDLEFTFVSVPERSSNPAVVWLGKSYFGVKEEKKKYFECNAPLLSL